MPFPAAARPVKRRSPARKNTMLSRLYDHVGDDVSYALAYSGDERADRLLDMMLDPAFSRFSFPRLCERAGLRTADVLGLLRRYYLDFALLEAYRNLPRVVEAVVQQAVGGMVPCPRCAGTGEGEGGRCRECWGKGEVYQRGDHKAQRLTLQMCGLVR